MDQDQPAIEDNQVEESRQILGLLLAEAKKRLHDPRKIRKLDTNEILHHIEKILNAVKKVPVLVNPQFIANIGDLRERAQTLDNHPTRRKESREEIRKELKLNRSATR